MENAFGQPHNVIVLGGSSDIATAIVRQLVAARTRTVVLAGRNQHLLDEAASSATAHGATATATATSTVIFDAKDPNNVAATIDACFAAVGEPIDLVIVAVGTLGDQDVDENNSASAAVTATVNYTWPVAALSELRGRLIAQGTGRILVISSVTAIRVSRRNYHYGAAKAGLDRYSEALAASLEGTGVSVQILRPGFVHSKMTAGMKAVPFATTPDAVATVTVAGLASGERVIHAPRILKWVFLVLRHAPTAIWSKVGSR
jgi:decaprenylphospho-beta-D-erythro-pentofuranosid-2-ulose 2-reductase